MGMPPANGSPGAPCPGNIQRCLLWTGGGEMPGGQKAMPSSFQVTYWERGMFRLETAEKVGWPDLQVKI